LVFRVNESAQMVSGSAQAHQKRLDDSLCLDGLESLGHQNSRVMLQSPNYQQRFWRIM